MFSKRISDVYLEEYGQVEDGEQLHVSMVHAPFGPLQRTGANSQQDV
jgi:hypothetical protein